MEIKLSTNIGDIKIYYGEDCGWSFSTAVRTEMPGVDIVDIELSPIGEAEKVPPSFTIYSKCEQIRPSLYRWTPLIENMCLPPDWLCEVYSELAWSVPINTAIGEASVNTATFSISDAFRKVITKLGINEYTSLPSYTAEFFTVPESPMGAQKISVRIDTRALPSYEAINSGAEWLEQMPEYKPCMVPECALEPLYSTWYNFHQDIHDAPIIKECAEAVKYGMKTVIVDDGWELECLGGGLYRYCGDWEPAKSRFPNMAEFVEKIHEQGMKVMLWFSVPFVGDDSKLAKRFGKMTLTRRAKLKTSILDPRFPEVREYLKNVYVTALKEWKLDGFKLDFIDNISLRGNPDPAFEDNYAGRDYKSIPEATDVMLSEISAALREIKPDIMIEFRQGYIGPAIRKYGNMLRAADCPADVLRNRLRTISLRLTSGKSAVHSDMIEWARDATPEFAALQFLAILFSVPQLSLKIEDLTPEQSRMMKHWIDFWVKHRETLMFGKLIPLEPECCYPVVTAVGADEAITAIYSPNRVVDFDGSKTLYVVNASGESRVIVNSSIASYKVELYNTFGEKLSEQELASGAAMLEIPLSGYAKLNTL